MSCGWDRTRNHKLYQTARLNKDNFANSVQQKSRTDSIRLHSSKDLAEITELEQDRKC